MTATPRPLAAGQLRLRRARSTTWRCSISTASSTWARTPCPASPEALAAARDGRDAAGLRHQQRRPHARGGRRAPDRLGVPAAATTSSPARRRPRPWSPTCSGPGPGFCRSAGPGSPPRSAPPGSIVVDRAEDQPAAVVQGYGREVGWAQLAEAIVAVRNGARHVATNLDATIPSPRGPAPGQRRDGRRRHRGHRAGRRSSPGSPIRPCTPSASAGPARGARSWSATGWTPTSRAPAGPERPACWCSPG